MHWLAAKSAELARPKPKPPHHRGLLDRRGRKAGPRLFYDSVSLDS